MLCKKICYSNNMTINFILIHEILGESAKEDDLKRAKSLDKRKSEKRCSVRKKIIGALAELNEGLPEGVENIGSSSSQDEADTEETPSKFRKRRKVLRKRHKHKKLIKCSKYNFCLTHFIFNPSVHGACSESKYRLWISFIHCRN